MRKILFAIVLFWSFVSFGQIQAEKTGGQLFEGYTSAVLNGLSIKPNGLLVRNSTVNTLWYWNGTEFKDLLSGGIDWSTPVNATITFDADDTYNIGSASAAPGTIYYNRLFGMQGSNLSITDSSNEFRFDFLPTTNKLSITAYRKPASIWQITSQLEYDYVDGRWEIDDVPISLGDIFKLNGDGEYYTNNRIASNYIHIKSPDDITGESSFNYVSLITQEDPVSSGTYYGAITTNAMAGGVSTSNRLTSVPTSWNILGVNNVGTHIGGSTSPSEKLEVTGNIDISGVYKINGVDVSTEWQKDTYYGILSGGTSLTSYNVDLSTSRKIDMAFTASTVTIDFINELQALGEPIIMRLTSQNAGGTVFTFSSTISDINNNTGFSVSLAENEEITLHFVVHDSTYTWCTNYPSGVNTDNQTLSDVLSEGNIMDANILLDSDVTRSIGNVTNALSSIYNRSYIFKPQTSDPTYTVNLGQTFYRSDLGKISYWDGTAIQRLATTSDAVDAVNIILEDSGTYFPTDNVEAGMQYLAAAVDAVPELINSDDFTGATTANVNSATGTKNYIDTAINNSLLLGSETLTASRSGLITDADGIVIGNSASAITYTVPTNASVPFAIGTVIPLKQTGLGPIALAYAGGVTGEAGGTYGVNSTIIIRKTGTNTWEVLQHPSHRPLTQTEYDALTPIEGILYLITGP